ncbi:uncharacterized protein LOC106143114 [Amyelois transitella]|uniref:uncharacterized protein LOC106143114 n=1 Tax=Amyelois transitella TaxID=680683 RepID=UPI00299032A7|nr:uncharacterized protein LOC106143114 [Amyelois transitella]
MHCKITIPPEGEKEITEGNYYEKYAMFIISPGHTGKWIFKTLTDRNASQVITRNNLTNIVLYKNTSYYNYQCEFNIKVSSPKIDDKMKLYYIAGGGILALIIIVQTGIICYILKAKKVRRIEQLLNRPRGSDTVRYSTMPGRKDLLMNGQDEGSIYETLDALQQAEEAPPPPPIETLPQKTSKRRPPIPLPTEKADIKKPDQNSTLKTTKGKEDVKPELFPPKPSLSENENTEKKRISRKLKLPSFRKASTADTATSDKSVKTLRKLSSVPQDDLSKKLNDELKKRQTGNMTPLKPVSPTIPEPVFEANPKDIPTVQSLKTQILRKASTTIETPTKPYPTLPRPVPPKKPFVFEYPTSQTITNSLPKKPLQNLRPAPTQPTFQPQTNPIQAQSQPFNSQLHPIPTQLSPMQKKLPTEPQLHPTKPTLHPVQPQLPPVQTQSHPIQPQWHPMPVNPSTQWINKEGASTPVSELPDYYYTEEPEYATYDDNEEWTYEALEPVSKYNYNVYD